MNILCFSILYMHCFFCWALCITQKVWSLAGILVLSLYLKGVVKTSGYCSRHKKLRDHCFCPCNKKKAEQTKNQELFLDPLEDSHRENCYSKIKKIGSTRELTRVKAQQQRCPQGQVLKKEMHLIMKELWDTQGDHI